MTISTVAVTIVAGQFTGQPLAGGKVRIEATGSDVITGASGEIVVSEPQSLSIDSGTATANLITNTAGTQGTQYRFTFSDAYGADLFVVLATVPAFACNLHDIVDTPAPATVDAAQVAVNAARDWASQTGGDVTEGVAGDRSSKSWAQEDLTPSGQNRGGSSKDWAISSTLPDGVNPSAKTSAAAAAATALQTAADRVQTGADRVQTDADVVAANAAKAQSNSNMLTAIAQASLASIYALSTASVAQQDLSGVTAAALHRGPAAVVAMCIDDPRTHSDGGAWTSKVDAASWMNEPLQGAWIPHPNVNGIQAEAVARALGGTLGANLVAAANNTTTAWAPVSSAALSLGTNNRLRVTNGAALAGAANWTIALTAGQTYVLYADVVAPIGTAAANLRVSSDNGVTWTALASTTAGAGVFTASVTGNYLVQFLAGTNAAGLYFEVGNFSLKQVTAWATSGSYYQSATDGKFYRLWKNLFQWSEQFDNAAWTKTGVTVTANAVAEPLAGTLTADKLVSSGGAGQQRVDAGVIPANGTISVYAKAGEANWLWIGSAQFGNEQAWFDLTNGVVGTKGSSLASSSITSLGGGWYRCQATLAAGATQGFGSIGVSGADNSVVGPVAGNGLYVWGAQLEYGTSATSYEQKVADGSQTETFRGNVAHYGRTAWVAETTRVVGYATDQPGRPMWMVFTSGLSGATKLAWNAGNQPINTIACGNGWLLIGMTSNGVVMFNFAKDDTQIAYVAQEAFNTRTIAMRNSAGTFLTGAGGYTIAATVVNAVAMTTMPDAPVDHVTGLQVPTIAVATNGGLSIIQNDGSVVSSASASNMATASISPYLLTANSGSTGFYALAPAKLGSAFSTSALSQNTAPDFIRGTIVRSVTGARGKFGRVDGAGRLALAWFNESNAVATPTAQITDTSNSGILLGDIRRCYLSDVSVGVVSGTEMFNPATVPTYANTGTATVSYDVPSKTFTVSATGTSQVRAKIELGLTIGKTYFLSASFTGQYTGAQTGPASGTITTSLNFSGPFVAADTGIWIVNPGGGNAGLTAGNTLAIASLSVVEAAADRSYKASALKAHGTLTKAQVGVGSQLVAYSGFSAANYLQEGAYSADLDFGTAGGQITAWVNYATAVASTIAERNAASGSYITLGTDASGHLTATAFDGTTTRTVTTTAAYNTGTWVQARAEVSPSGSVTIKVNGQQVAQATGNPLLTLNNASAVLTVGNNFALTAAFPGSISLVRIGATLPTADQSTWMYEQEKEMFRDGAQVTLPDSGAVMDLDYDPVQDKWKVVSAANESSFVGLVLTSQAPVPAGSFTHVAHKSGIKLLSRSTTNPGVDITIPAKNALEEFNRRAEDARALARLAEPFDFVGGFTATTTTGSALLTSVASLSIPAAATVRGAQVTGTGIPANTTILDIQGTTIQLSAACTAAGSGVSVSFTDFILPTGYEAKSVNAARAIQYEGATADWTRKFDGFREGEHFPAPPGPTAKVQLIARRIG